MISSNPQVGQAAWPWQRASLTALLAGAVLYVALAPWAASGWSFHWPSDRQLSALLLSALLVPLNLWLEVRKWQTAFPPAAKPAQAWRAILIGTTLGMLTPNRLGDYWGRLKGLPRSQYPSAIAATFLCRTSQWGPLLTLALPLAVLGASRLSPLTISFVWLPVTLLAVTGLGTLLALPRLLAALPTQWLQRKPAWHRFGRHLQDQLRLKSPTLIFKVLIYSHLRMLVYLLQFSALLIAMGATDHFLTGLYVSSAVFVGKSVFPSLTLAELGIRELLTVVAGTALGLPQAPLVAASLLLFTLNLALPSLLGFWLWQRRTNPAAIAA